MYPFKPNMGTVDRIIRFTVGSLLIVLGPVTNTFNDPTSNILLSVVGGIAVFSALMAYCGLYALTGFCTHTKE